MSDQAVPANSRACVSGSERFRFIDALRGIAALGVVVHHINLYGPLREPSASLAPNWIGWTDEVCWIGVQIFFVISGFVIAYSLRNAFVTPSFFGNFALRRSLRLDPSYWAVVLLVTFMHFLPHVSELPSPHEEGVSAGQVLTHFAYLQNVLQYDNLSAGFWTLCVEMQFYLLFCLMLALSQRLSRCNQTNSRAKPVCLSLIFMPLAIGSLFVFNRHEHYDDWILYYFAMFFLGSAVWWALDRRIPTWLFCGYVLVMVARLYWHWSLEIAVALATGVIIYLVGLVGHLGDWLRWRPLQYLGRISYSLYLIHYPVSHLVMNAGHRLTGDSPLPALIWSAVAIALSIAAAHLLYTFVEAPTARLASHFKRRERVSEGLAEVLETRQSYETAPA